MFSEKLNLVNSFKITLKFFILNIVWSELVQNNSVYCYYSDGAKIWCHCWESKKCKNVWLFKAQVWSISLQGNQDCNVKHMQAWPFTYSSCTFHTLVTVSLSLSHTGYWFILARDTCSCRSCWSHDKSLLTTFKIWGYFYCHLKNNKIKQIYKSISLVSQTSGPHSISKIHKA